MHLKLLRGINETLVVALENCLFPSSWSLFIFTFCGRRLTPRHWLGRNLSCCGQAHQAAPCQSPGWSVSEEAPASGVWSQGSAAGWLRPGSPDWWWSRCCHSCCPPCQRALGWKHTQNTQRHLLYGYHQNQSTDTWLKRHNVTSCTVTIKNGKTVCPRPYRVKKTNSNNERH
jgi:hypothetical protein